MGSGPPTIEPHVERPGPAEFRDPMVVRELKRAEVWFGLAQLIDGVIVLAQQPVTPPADLLVAERRTLDAARDDPDVLHGVTGSAAVVTTCCDATASP